jgi:hypothetical protein
MLFSITMHSQNRLIMQQYIISLSINRNIWGSLVFKEAAAHLPGKGTAH